MNIFTSTGIFKFLLSFSFPVIINCNIASIVVQFDDICNGGENIWTVGYKNRSLRATVLCYNNCNSLVNNSFWCQYQDDKCDPLAFIGSASVTNNASAKWIDSNISSLISELEIFNVVKSSPSTLSYALIDFGSGFLSRINISVKYCPEKNEKNVAITDSREDTAISSGTYANTGYFNCPTGEYLVNVKERNLVTDNTTTCITCAQWKGMNEMDCWKAPEVSVKLTNLIKSYIPGHILIATEICKVIDSGKPEANPNLSWNTGNSNDAMPNVTLQAKDNNKTIYCSMKNELTDLLQNGLVLSEPLLLSIQFGPTEWSNETSCTPFDDGSNLYNATLELSFSANPIGTAEFLDKNGKPKNFTTTIGTAECCGVLVHQYRIVLTNVPADYIIIFNYQQPGLNTTSQFDLSKSCRSTGMTTAFSTNPSEVVTTSSAKSGVDTSSAKSVDTTSEKPLDTTAKPDTLSVGLIVGIAVGGVILIILIIIMIVLIIRRRRKGDISDPPAGSSNIQEERTNPVYGTTELNSSGESKEVVENVLYGTRDATNSPADEYAEVVPKGKRKKTKTEPKDNGEAAASAEATYAVVDKKNKGKSGSDNAGYSGDPQPEETYAVVNKKGKKT